jgi:cyclophilin family peptidyl-prolyl cis-trans isomerase
MSAIRSVVRCADIMVLSVLLCVGLGCRPDKPAQPANTTPPPAEPAAKAASPAAEKSAANAVNPAAEASKPAAASQPAVPGLPEGVWVVELKTSKGDIVLVLDHKAAPVTVKNFVQYVQDGFFDGTIFHRVIKGFMIQGGGFTVNMQQKPTRAPITNEASNGLKNLRGTIAMARTNNPNSATAQFFINHANNTGLNFVQGQNPGYAVFGSVIKGLEVVDAIASVATTFRGGMQDVPTEPVTITYAKVLQQPKP